MDREFKLVEAIKSNNTCEQICELDDSMILEKIIPKVKGMKEIGECKYHVVNCFNHTIYALEEFEQLIREDNFPSHLKQYIWEYLNKEVEKDIKVLSILKLGVFLHDIGKADARTVDAKGRAHFRGHDKLSGNIAVEVGNKLKLSPKSIELLYKYTRYHMYLLTIYKKNDAGPNILNEMFDKLQDDIIGVMLLGYADITATKRLLEPKEDEEILKTYMNYVLTNYLYKYKKNVSF